MTETVDSTSRIQKERDAIDAIDAHIIELLNRRAHVSSGIQKMRTDAGGPRTVFTREMEILARYRDGLGECGTQIATSVLKLCRGVGTLQPTVARPEGAAS
ncbi:chorismate mutase [Streptomyces sp. NPDC002130]|uniref:chorismate mutase n=1 Tax=Streptomyces sp. NPDC002130 TaxID=3155568 RepID=UPI003330C516